MIAESQRQIHVSNGTRVQTLASRASDGGLTLLSTFSGDPALTEIHIPVAALSWLVGEVQKVSDLRGQAAAAALAGSAARGPRQPPIVPPIDQIRAEANPSLGVQPGSAAA